MIALRIVLLFLFAASIIMAAGAEPTRTAQLNQVPPEARKAIEAQLAGAKITDIEIDEDDGTFTVSFKSKEGEKRDFTVAEDGTLMSVEVALDEAPPSVQKTIKGQVGPGTIENVEKAFDEDEITYDVDMKSKEGVERCFSVTLDGKLQAMQLFLEETPAPVKKTIESSLGSVRLEDIFHIFEPGETSYYVEVRRDGKLRACLKTQKAQ